MAYLKNIWKPVTVNRRKLVRLKTNFFFNAKSANKQKSGAMWNVYY